MDVEKMDDFLATHLEEVRDSANSLKEANRQFKAKQRDWERRERDLRLACRASTDWMGAKNETIRKAETEHIAATDPDRLRVKDALDQAEVDLYDAKIDYEVSLHLSRLMAEFHIT